MATSQQVQAVTAIDVAEAAERIRPFIHRTPVLTSRSLDERSGTRVFLKAENFQRGGSFKIRGAMNFIRSIPKDQIARGVVAFSSGNHAQAVAIAAQEAGTSATIVMPSDAPRSKHEATLDRGARVITYDRHSEDREEIARRIAAETGAAVIPPFDHPWIVAGAGTCALELLDEVPDLDAIVVCLGGGGFLAGSSLAAHRHNSQIRMYGAEPELGDDYAQSLRAGHPIEIDSPATIADGLRTRRPGDLPFAVIQRHAAGVLLVSEDEIKETLRFLLARLKILVEPSGAAACAAVLFRKLPVSIRKVGVTLSGGNIDLDQLALLCS